MEQNARGAAYEALPSGQPYKLSQCSGQLKDTHQMQDTTTTTPLVPNLS